MLAATGSPKPRLFPDRDVRPISDRMCLALERVPSEQYDMSITTTVEGGKIVLPPDVHWPSGTVVRVEPVESQPPTLWETLNGFDGMASDLPADLVANIDHYVHGHRRP